MATLPGGGFRLLVGGGNEGLHLWMGGTEGEMEDWLCEGGGWMGVRRMAGPYFPLFSWFDCGQGGVLVIHKEGLVTLDGPKACINVDGRGSGGVTVKGGAGWLVGRSVALPCVGA